MPDYFTHLMAAENIYERLEPQYKNAITNKTLYLLGAQGGDVFFFYTLSYKNNVGRNLHREDAAHIFEQLIKGDRSYAAGWATHYALDSTVHPIIYAYERTAKGFFVHQKFERDLGLFISRKTGLRRRILPREDVLSCTLPVCDSIRGLLPFASPDGIATCLKRHFAFSRRMFRSKKQEYYLDADYEKPYKAYLDACEFGAQAVKAVLDGNADKNIFNKSFLQKY